MSEQSGHRPPWHQRAPLGALLVSALGTLAAIAVLAWLLLPGISSALAAEVADGQRSFAIGSESATVTPEAGWSVRTEGDGLLLYSPDGALAVRLSPAGGAQLTGPVSSETLASGLALRHVTLDGAFTGVLDTPGGSLLVDARLDDVPWSRLASRLDAGAEFDRYRPALSSLLESVRAP